MGMLVVLNFTRTIAATTFTAWTSLKWTYLVVSSTFDGSYTNIWCTSATLTSSLPSSNLPLDPVGSAFLAQGGEVGDCDIFVDPLFQTDLVSC